MSDQRIAIGGTDGEPAVLSTGHRVMLPLSTHATITGAVFSASKAAIASLLPNGLKPIRATPTRAAVTFLCVEYDRIGYDTAIDPYNEFGVLLPAIPEDKQTVPYASLLTHGVSGYVEYLPVTTEPARALGVDIWGYPKEVAEITHRDEGSVRHTSVRVDGERLIDIAIDRPPQLPWRQSGVSYTEQNGTVLRERLELDGRLGMWPYSDRVDYVFGEHPRAQALSTLDLGDRALLRFAADAEFRIHEGEAIGPV